MRVPLSPLCPNSEATPSRTRFSLSVRTAPSERVAQCRSTTSNAPFMNQSSTSDGDCEKKKKTDLLTLHQQCAAAASGFAIHQADGRWVKVTSVGSLVRLLTRTPIHLWLELKERSSVRTNWSHRLCRFNCVHCVTSVCVCVCVCNVPG